jgi:hypothetical protein
MPLSTPCLTQSTAAQGMAALIYTVEMRHREVVAQLVEVAEPGLKPISVKYRSWQRNSLSEQG